MYAMPGRKLGVVGAGHEQRRHGNGREAVDHDRVRLHEHAARRMRQAGQRPMPLDVHLAAVA
jgi:hypothetical protein